MKTLRTILMVCLALGLTTQLEAKKVKLKHTLQKGQEIKFETVITQEISQEMMGQAQETSTEVTQNQSFVVKEVLENGNYLLEWSVDRYRTKMSSMMGDMELDTDNMGDNQQMADLFNSFTNKKVLVELASNGDVVDIKDLDAYMDDLTAKLEGLGQEAALLGGMVSQFSTKEAIVQNVGGLLMNYPTEKIKKGKSWERETTLEQMVAFSSVINTTLGDVQGDVATLVQEVKIDMGEGQEPMEMQGMTMEYDLSGGKKGSYEVDLTSGLVISGEGVTVIEGVISVDSPQLPAPMSIPMTLKTTEKITRL